VIWRRLFARSGVGLIAGLGLTACGTANLYIAHDTVVGLNAVVDSQRTSGRLSIGYDRNFGTYVPAAVPAQDGSGGKEAMSVVSCSELKVKGIWLSNFTEYLGTGEAAERFAAAVSKGGQSEVFDCLRHSAAAGSD
jgi:hypothetical protein